MRPYHAILSLAVAAAISGCTYSTPADSSPMPAYPAYLPLAPSYTPAATPIPSDSVSAAPMPPSLGMPTSTMPLGISEFTTLAPIDPLSDLQSMDLSAAMQDLPATQPDAATAQATAQPDATATASRPATQPQYVPGPAVQSGMPVYSGDEAESYPQIYYSEPVYVPQYVYEPAYVPVYYPVYQPYCAPYYCDPAPFCGTPTFGFGFQFGWCPGVTWVDHNHGHGPIGHPHDGSGGSRSNQRVLTPVVAYPAPPAEKPHPPMVMPKGVAASGRGVSRPVVAESPLSQKPAAKAPVRGGIRVPDRENISKLVKPDPAAQTIVISPVIKPSAPVAHNNLVRERSPAPSVVKSSPAEPKDAPETPVTRAMPKLSNAPAKLPVMTHVQPRNTDKPAAKDAVKEVATPRARPIVTADHAPAAPAPEPVARSSEPAVARSEKPATNSNPRFIAGADREQATPRPAPLVRASEPVILRRETAPVAITHTPEPPVRRDPVAAPVVKAPEVHSAPEPVRAAPQVHASAPQPVPAAAPAGRSGGLAIGQPMGRGR